MGACGVDFNCAVCAEISGVNVWDQWLEPDLKKQNALTLLTCARAVRFQKKSKGSKICPEGKAWAKRTFDTYPSAYANLAASKYCKDPNYAKKSKGGKRKGK